MNNWNIGNNNEKLKNTLSREVYSKLLDKFYQNELAPGDIINRREVATELNVSVAPVLEAMLKLEMEGFLESLPRKGTVVKPIRIKDVQGQLMVREAIECQAARLYCGKPIEENMEQLLNDAMELEKTGMDVPGHWQKELDFHQKLVELSGCEALVVEYIRTIRLGVFYRVNRIVTESDKEEHLNHPDLIKKLAIADADFAEKLIREHLRSGKQHAYS